MLIAQRPEISAVDSEKNNHQRFSIGPLEPGFGFTLGNSLRRILLSTLGGAAITKVKFEGVSHEFSTIPGVREDVTDIILNLKDVVVKSHVEEEVVISVDVSGQGREGTVITAEVLNTNADIEILNPEQPLATVNSGAKLEADFTIGVGRGYMPAGTIPQSNIGQISIDAIFSPIRRVAIDVEPMQVEESTEYDRLILDVFTDGTVAPKDALASAAATLKALSELIENFGDEAMGLEFAEIVEEIPKELARSVLELNLSQRAENCLMRSEIKTVGQLLECTQDQLLGITNFGRNSLDEVVEKLDEIGLALSDAFGVAEIIPPAGDGEEAEGEAVEGEASEGEAVEESEGEATEESDSEPEATEEAEAEEAEATEEADSEPEATTKTAPKK